ncbi:MAG: methylamine utilization protein [Nannocystis sp.]|nr:cytochrome c peroxidase [Nannocystis sp.]MBA3545015.1 methylamine utilization protein [Nannocystis sp.]
MSNHITTILAGALLAIPLANYLQCSRRPASPASPAKQASAPQTPSAAQMASVPQTPSVAAIDFTAPGPVSAQSTEKLEELGKRVFFDNISVPKRMSCATCHNPAAGWTFKNSGVNLHQVAVPGADPHEAGSIKPPSNAYASKTGRFRTCDVAPLNFCGGNFWNGRAEGNPTPLFPGATDNVGAEVFDNAQALKPVYERFLGPTADQALNPFPNTAEQNIEERQVCRHVESSKYAKLFTIAWGEPINCKDEPYGGQGFKAFEVNFRRLAVALSAWQDSKEVNSFSAKRDIALATDKDGKFPLDGLTAQENRGHDLFYATFNNPVTIGGVPKFANCTLCHSDNPLTDDGTEKLQLYSDDSYHNIGVPANPEIVGFPVLNLGLEGHTGDTRHRGAQKTPTLRNVDKRPGKGFKKAYTHNGWFKSLESLVHFYNTAFIDGETAKAFGLTRCAPTANWTAKAALAANCWPVPEHVENSAIPFLVGDLKLTAEDEAAIVAYLKTFTDTQTPTQPKPYKP